jgi:sugar O-acyltransferase (sialic acid O-acetyltransferase NeuD family)
VKPIVVVGAGGFGRESLDVIEAINAATPTWELVGVVDDAPAAIQVERLADRRIQHLGGLDALLHAQTPIDYVVGIGSPRIRERVAARLDAAGFAAATLVHPAASVGSCTELEEGVVVCGGAQISTNVRLGKHVHVNPNATIGHDARLDGFVSINPAAVVSGEVEIGSGTLIGAAAVVLQNLTIGADAVVGAAACVTRNVPPGATVKGVPAR